MFDRMRGILVRILLPIGVVAICAGIYYALMWSLTYHPVALIAAIAIGAVPIIFFGVRFGGREQQRRSVWSSIRDTAKGKLSSVPEAPPERTLIGIGSLLGVQFKAISISANANGLRLDRPLRAVRPIVVPWDKVQRVDVYDIGEVQKIGGRSSRVGARIFLLDLEQPIVLFPWSSSLQEFVPSRIGSEPFSAT